MKHFYRLLNYEFGQLLRQVLIVCAGLIVMTVIFIKSELKNYTPYSVNERYEHLFSTANGPLIFMISYLVLMFAFILSLRAPYTGGKSIYTFLTLPVRREWLYISKVSSFLISIVLLLSSQLVAYVIGYKLMEQHISSYGDGQFVMHNGLFLSFIRSDFMRIIWPFSFIGLLSTASIILVSITAIYYGHLAIQSNKRWRLVPIAVIPSLLIGMIGIQSSPLMNYDEHKLILPSLILLCLSLLFIWHTVWLLKKGDVA
ncbi:hypothetical protein [Paenibacillus sp. IITD108]|uniref:hypothetical protein n=1 Tax=Paenibacillus sp. IITD108 TaxID=3116649 RepID=UPI002F40915C